jgi:hypothetical protein
MIRLARFGSLIAKSSLANFCLLYHFPGSYAQETSSADLAIIPKCSAADLDATPQFFNGPIAYYTIAINVRNISDHACLLDRNPEYGSIYKNHIGMDTRPFGYSYKGVGGQPLALNPDQFAHMTFRWIIVPHNPAVQCPTPGGMSGPVLLDAPSLMKPMCSDIEVSDFRLGDFPGIAAGQDKSTQADGTKPLLQLSADRSAYYAGESFYLHISSIPDDDRPQNKKDACPKLYLLERTPDGFTRLDETGWGELRCHKPLADWRSGYEMDSGALSRWGGLGEQRFEVFKETYSRDGGPVHFAHSNVLRLSIVDASTIARKWGAKEKGIAVDVTLDKDTFQLGEDVALHIAIENFDATVPVYAANPVWDLCGLVGVNIFDATGKPLADAQRFQPMSICMGNHGFPAILYPPGKAVPIERTLASENALPNHAGDYTVVVTWSACLGNPSTGIGDNSPPQVCATAQARATLHIVSHGDAHLKQTIRVGKNPTGL